MRWSNAGYPENDPFFRNFSSIFVYFRVFLIAFSRDWPMSPSKAKITKLNFMFNRIYRSIYRSITDRKLQIFLKKFLILEVWDFFLKTYRTTGDYWSDNPSMETHHWEHYYGSYEHLNKINMGSCKIFRIFLRVRTFDQLSIDRPRVVVQYYHCASVYSNILCKWDDKRFR